MMVAMKIKSLSTVLTVALLCSATGVYGSLKVVGSKSLDVKSGGKLSNLAIYNQRLYIGGTNVLYCLNMDLSKNSTASTCDEGCENTNMLLIAGEWGLITCGTGLNGTCQLRGIDNITSVLRTSSTARGDLIVSSNRKRSVQGIVTNGQLVIAVTFGTGIAQNDCSNMDYITKTYQFGISTREIPGVSSFLPVSGSSSSKSKALNICVPDIGSDLEKYVIYYKALFENSGFNYFITNQKINANSSDNTYISKIIRICQNDTGYYSYIDMQLSCGQTDFNLIQDAVIIKSNSYEHVFVGAFTKGSAPEQPTGDTAICSLPLATLNEKIEEAQKIYIGSCKSYGFRYVEKDYRVRTTNCSLINQVEQTLYNKDYMCNTLIPTVAFAVANSSLNLTYQLTVPSEDGYVETLHDTVTDGNISVLYAGTSQGNLIMMNVDEKRNNVSIYSKKTISPNDPIQTIRAEDDFLFILSEQKIFRLKFTSCTEFLTCVDTMSGRDPFCGWCVYQNRSTRKDDCKTDVWIPAVDGKCLSINTNVSEVEITDGTSGIQHTMEVQTENWSDIKEYNYKCQFRNQAREVISNTPATLTGGTKFVCAIPNVQEHTIGTLHLLVNTGAITNLELASHKFLFFKCSYYRKCSECVQKCDWCDEKTTCVSKRNSSNCPGFVNASNSCPRLAQSVVNRIPISVSTQVNLTSSDVTAGSKKYYCVVMTGSTLVQSDAKVDGANITCNLTMNVGNEAQNYYRILIKYGMSDRTEDLVEMDDDYNNKVTVYNCLKLGSDCTHCQALQSVFKCDWCSGACRYSCSRGTCPFLNITELSPDNGPQKGGTVVTLGGTDLGETMNDTTQVKISGISCKININASLDGCPEDKDVFAKKVPCKIVCTTGEIDTSSNFLTNPGNVTLTFKGATINATPFFYYKMPSVDAVGPKKGPLAGGTLITFSGKNLGVGNQRVTVLFSNNLCNDAKVTPFIPGTSWKDRDGKTFFIECFTTKRTEVNVNGSTEFTLYMDEFESSMAVINKQKVEFQYLENPVIYPANLNSSKGIASGGIQITITGRNLTNANKATLKGKYGDIELISPCDILNDSMTICKGPKAPEAMLEKLRLMEEEAGRRRKRSTCDRCITVEVHFDGVTEPFIIEFYQDPTINESNEVVLFGTRERELTIRGKNLNLVAKESDINITIGIGTCTVFKLTSDYLTCIAPTDEPQKADVNSPFPEIKVRIGNIERTVGYIEYKKEVELIAIIAGSIGGVMFAVIVIGFSIGILKYRKIRKKSKQYQRNLSDMEMEIRKVAREEFLDMHTTMSSVNRNLVEQGFPYHSYQQYACNVMFSVDYLWTEPVVSNGKMTDDERIKANKGMEIMESLIHNKFFIVSVISTMEKQKRFFIREKANLAGNLCAVLMGKMDYLEEILKMLLSNLVQETPSKKQKSLFRRCESITEKLLSNWLSLCLYPHIRANSGSPLYLLYIATQKTMESGPIDAILGDAKYTLYEEKLLKKWSSSEEGTQDLKFEAKTLTLNVVVDNGDTIFKCKVLDCDTISQVKSKCMAQIYVNYPASQLNVDPQDLDLEWHEGFGGALRLKDEDNTSKHDGPWVRLNTLAHYNVKDESNMALVDPHGAENKEEDYVNLTNVNVDNACDASVDSTEPLHPRDMQNPGALQHWHLVRKEEETSKQGKSAIAELYLNRLFTTKQCLMEYISTLFNIVLEKDRCPPPTKCLFDFLDDLGDRHKIDADTLYTWKSHSYAIRVWASLIKMPSLLFDVNIPNYVEENLDVISQVFIESFSLSSQKFTKDSPSQKLIFHNEMNVYRDKVKEFYKNVKVDSQAQDEYRQYMMEVNKQQQQTNFNKVSALYRLYKQLKPYFEEILEDLTTCKETSNLRLNKKLEEVMEIMEDEEK